jgi:RNA polymerase sigma factor (sigma-70 family)
MRDPAATRRVAAVTLPARALRSQRAVESEISGFGLRCDAFVLTKRVRGASTNVKSKPALERVPLEPVPFERVVAIHGPTVLRVCRAVVGPVDADDAWSETFLSALRAYPELPADANVEAWLVTIAHRKAIDVVRKTARRAVATRALENSVNAVRPAAAADRADDGTHIDVDVATALAQLPPKQKQAIAYHYLAGLPYAEVAEILGGTTDAARRAAADGIANLRSHPDVVAEKRARR